ncbi:MAG: hypothetical protein ACRCR4_06135 [Thiotrichaceae bacterium]
MILSISEIIENAKVAQYVCANQIARAGIWGGGIPSYLPKLIYDVRKTVERTYDLDSSDESLTATANYLYAISVKYFKTNTEPLQGSGGGIAPVTPGTIMPEPYDFYVTTSSFIISGQSAKTITRFVGYNIVFNRNGVPQSTVNPGDGGSYYSWNPNTGLFQFWGEAIEGELFSINPV